MCWPPGSPPPRPPPTTPRCAPGRTAPATAGAGRTRAEPVRWCLDGCTSKEEEPMTGPRLRHTLAGIPAYVAGRNPLPRAGLTTYKLSSNENPYPPLPGVLEAAVAAAGAM